MFDRRLRVISRHCNFNTRKRIILNVFFLQEHALNLIVRRIFCGFHEFRWHLENQKCASMMKLKLSALCLFFMQLSQQIVVEDKVFGVRKGNGGY